MIDKDRLENHLNNGELEYVMAAAVYINDGIDYSLKPYNIDKGYVVSGWRHPCIWESIKALTGKIQIDFGKFKIDWIDGFLTTKNRFLTREEALELVIENNQLLEFKGLKNEQKKCEYCAKFIENKCVRFGTSINDSGTYYHENCFTLSKNFHKKLLYGGELTSEDLW